MYNKNFFILKPTQKFISVILTTCYFSFFIIVLFLFYNIDLHRFEIILKYLKKKIIFVVFSAAFFSCSNVLN